MSTETTSTEGRARRGRHLAQPGDELVGGVRHRPGRHDPGHRHRALRRAGHGGGRHPGHRAGGGHRHDRVSVHGRAGRPVAAPHRRHALVRLRELQAPRAERRPSTSAACAGGATGWAGSRWRRSTCCWPPAYIAVLFHVPAGPDASHRSARLGTPVSIGVLLITFVGLIGAVRALLPRDPPRGHVRHHPRRDLDGAPHPAVIPAGVQALQLPLVQRLGLPLRRPQDRRGRSSSWLDLRDLVERHRHGGGRLLHRRMPRPRPRRQDRPHRRGPLRRLHLHRHGRGLRRGARSLPQDGRPAHPVHQLLPTTSSATPAGSSTSSGSR